MKKNIALIMAAVMCLALAACGSSSSGNAPAETTKAAETTAAPETTKAAETTAAETTAAALDVSKFEGTYTYDDYKADADFTINWTLDIDEEGGFYLTEYNEMRGETLTYVGQEIVAVDGNTLTMGPMNPGPDHFDWANPEGFQIVIDGDTFEPIFDENAQSHNGPEGGPQDDGPQAGGPQAEGETISGSFTFDEYKADADFTINWTLDLDEEGGFYLTEYNEMRGETLTYVGQEYTVEGNTVKCGPMNPAPDHFDWANPEGFTVVINGDTFEPVE